jgi:tRNA-uridine 2-sulfurtransferase
MIELIGDAARGEEWASLRLSVSDHLIVDASGAGRGASDLARAVRGLTLLEAAAVPGEELAVDALADALGPAVRAAPDARRVAVALSGGVDSAVALMKTRDAGLEPVGVTLRLWLDPAGPAAERACCSPESVRAARRLCHDLRVPHVSLDLRERFRRAVVAPFVAAYARGETPNPCVRCNGGFRFAELLACARRLGAARLATGHYARLAEHRGRLLLARASDRCKDQSYMLGRLDPRLLGRLSFPLGEQTKEETRAQARGAGLAAAEGLESQEACFLAGDDYRNFLTRQGLTPREGSVLDLDGRVLGRHLGFWRFTPGQRRGIGVSSPTGTLYAVRTDPARNAVVVGPREALARRRLSVSPGRLYVPLERVEAKLRYRSPSMPATARERARGFELELDEPAYGVAAGQAAVLYEDDAVVGAGLISASLR